MLEFNECMREEKKNEERVREKKKSFVEIRRPETNGFDLLLCWEDFV